MNLLEADVSFQEALQSSQTGTPCEAGLDAAPDCYPRQGKAVTVSTRGRTQKILILWSYEPAMENGGQVKAGFELMTLPFPPNQSLSLSKEGPANLQILSL